VALDTEVIIQPLGFPLPGDPHVRRITHETCGQDCGPGGSRCMYVFGSRQTDQHHNKRRTGAVVRWSCLHQITWSNEIASANFMGPGLREQSGPSFDFREFLASSKGVDVLSR